MDSARRWNGVRDQPGSVIADTRQHSNGMRENKEKVLAHASVREAIKSGRLSRQPCEACGDPQSHAHHDYTRRLDVRWLPAFHRKEELKYIYDNEAEVPEPIKGAYAKKGCFVNVKHACAFVIEFAFERKAETKIASNTVRQSMHALSSSRSVEITTMHVRERASQRGGCGRAASDRYHAVDTASFRR